MYTKRIQLLNCGPIGHIDLTLPFDGEKPLPAIFIGENGSGKTILLSHIINGLLTAQGVAFPDTPEVDLGKVYKLRSSSYIKAGNDVSFSRVDYDHDFHIEEIRLAKPKGQYPSMPEKLLGLDRENRWAFIADKSVDYFNSNIDKNHEDNITDIFSRNCILYFPANRFEDPAWLNETNLNSKANYTGFRHFSGHTTRQIVNISCLENLQNWLFDLVYDRTAFEIQTHHLNNLAIVDNDQVVTTLLGGMPVFRGYQGEAANTYNLALSIIRNTLRLDNTGRFGFGRRQNRVISIIQNERAVVPNIFQLSSGETSLITLFLSILKDYDLSGSSANSPENIQGIVIVDEVDLHLNAVHQYEVLPKLMSMFPKVQFLITSHSPLFILGLQEELGNDGFQLYRLPGGREIGPEEFEEFGDAYRAFRQTMTFAGDMKSAIEESQGPIVFVDGETDVLYLRRAAELLGFEEILERVQVKPGGGDARAKVAWKALEGELVGDIITRKTIFLHDCDSKVENSDRGAVFRRRVECIDENPIKRGMENLFKKKTLEKAIRYKPAFIDIIYSYSQTVRGVEEIVPERWAVNRDEKMNLCRWLCENGVEEDFRGMQIVFEMLQTILGLVTADTSERGE